jgi:hypothetical protein
MSRCDARAFADMAAELRNIEGVRMAAHLAGDPRWLSPARLPVLMQVLAAGDESARKALAGHLAGVKGEAASDALARIALYDPAPEVRRDAITSLRTRPAAEYRDTLLAGLASPWPVMAEHAAEALAALPRVEAVPALRAALERADPGAPYSRGTGRYVRELVRVNHQQNCLMCHAASFNDADPLRAPVPPSPDPAPTPTGPEYYSSAPSPTQRFVRADITYLRQDYSVVIDGIRHDLFVRERPATAEDEARADARRGVVTRHQQAAAFALRELDGETGTDGISLTRLAGKHRGTGKGR